MRRPVILIPVLLIIAAAAVVAMLWGTGVIGTAQSDPVGSSALAYAHARTLWTSGPTIRSERVVPLDQLNAALVQASVPLHIRQDVNVPDFIAHYGATHRVALVVLFGSYNSLPPDEGVPVTGDVVAIVNEPSNTVLLLTD